MLSIPPSLVQQQQAQGLLAARDDGAVPPAPSKESLLLAAGDLAQQGALHAPRTYNHASHRRWRNG